MFDLNHSGKIDTDNLGQLMNRLGYTPSDDDLKLMINDMDFQRKNCISFLCYYMLYY